MPNPVLNDKTFAAPKTEADAGWAAPEPATQTGTTWHPPISDGPISPYRRFEAMTMSGTITATAVLFALLLVGAVVGWGAVKVTGESPNQVISTPWWIWLPPIAAFALVIVTVFKPTIARFTAPLYAIGEGVFVGAISHVFEIQYQGIVVQAVGATLGVFLVTLVMYALRIVKVTQRFRSIVIAATFGLAIFYMFSIVLHLFGVDIGFINQPTGLGIAFSVFAAGLAAFNLFLDYDIIERGVKAQAPKYFEWMAALGLVVTLVWLYLEMLRLIGKLRSR
jgi:uncharacterized YccA/Bax inhibitor family protein